MSRQFASYVFYWYVKFELKHLPKNKFRILFSSSDAAIKLWNIHKDLMAQITLDNTLSTACFLNSSGDILLAFKNDIYILYHTKMLHVLRTSIQTRVSEAGKLNYDINSVVWVFISVYLNSFNSDAYITTFNEI